MALRDRLNFRPDLSYELSLLRSGVLYVAGLDEAGRGAWAGPVYAAAVILPINRFDLARCLDGVRDSKQMTPLQREKWAIQISRIARAIGVGRSSAQEVDNIGLISATRLAMTRALATLCEPATTVPAFVTTTAAPPPIRPFRIERLLVPCASNLATLSKSRPSIVM